MDPYTWIYLALLAAGTAANAKAQQKTNQARSKVAAEERDRRKIQQKQAEASAQKTQETFFDQRGDTAAREAELAQQFQPQAAAPTTDATGTRFLDTAAPTSSTATIEATKGQVAKGQGRATQRAVAQSQLGAFGDVLRNNNLAASRNAQDIGQGANFMQSWQQNVLPALYAKANVAGKDWATAGDIMKLAAAVMSVGALSGAGAAGGAGAGAGTGEMTAQGIHAAQTPWLDWSQPAMQGGAVPWGSSYGVADAAAGAAAASKMSEADMLNMLGNHDPNSLMSARRRRRGFTNLFFP